MEAPKLIIIAGCNGAGKTTAAYSILKDMLDCIEFVNADEIAKGLSPFNPESVAIEAGRLMLKRIDELLQQKKTFAIETTMATRIYQSLVTKCKSQGYDVQLLFFWLSSPEVAKERVAARVASGGHSIPVDVIERRYWQGLKNLFSIYIPIVDNWMMIDNNLGSEIIADENGIYNDTLLNRIKDEIS